MKNTTGLVILCIMVPAMALFIALGYRSGSAQAPSACGDAQIEKHMRAMMFNGIDAAFISQIQHLFEVWMKNAHEQDQPVRAKTGADQAISAYLRSRRAMEDWRLAPC